MKSYDLLIIEDEPLMCRYYQLMIEEMTNDTISFKADVCKTYDEANQLLESKYNFNKYYHLVILDLRLMDRSQNKVHDGGKLGEYIRLKMPNSKIIVYTSYSSDFKFHQIFNKINPEGFWIKDEIESPNVIKNSIYGVLENKTTYGTSVLRFLQKQKKHLKLIP